MGIRMADTARGYTIGPMAATTWGSYGGVHRTSLYLIDQVRCQVDSLSSQFIIVQTWVRTEAS
eukprot:COSAG01_NODE_39720_length_472_cov_36.466488_1_plen_63_part_00